MANSIKSTILKLGLTLLALAVVIISLAAAVHPRGIAIVKPQQWFAEGKTVLYFYLGSGTYGFSSEGGTFGHLLFGQDEASGNATSYPSRKAEGYYQQKSQGKVVALWYTYTNNSDPKLEKWHYYYTASPDGSSIIFPDRPNNDWHYNIYGFFGHLELFEEGFDPKRYDGEAIRYDPPGQATTYRVGKADSFYYFIEPRQPNYNGLPTWTSNQVWQELKGIEITKEQFDSIICFEIHKPDCTPFLSEARPLQTSPPSSATIWPHTLLVRQILPT